MPGGADNFTLEARSQLYVDFKTARAYRRAKRCTDCSGVRPELCHSRDSASCNRCQDPAPPRVNRGHDSPLRIRHQQRHTVGRKNAEQDAGVRRDHPVTGATGLATFRIDYPNHATMHLGNPSERAMWPELFPNPLPVGADRSRVVANRAGEVEAAKRTATYPAQAAEKSVAQTRRLPRLQHWTAVPTGHGTMQKKVLHGGLFVWLRITYNFVFWNLRARSFYERSGIHGSAQPPADEV